MAAVRCGHIARIFHGRLLYAKINSSAVGGHRQVNKASNFTSPWCLFVGKIEIGIYVVGAADELIRVDHFLPEDISVRYQVV